MHDRPKERDALKEINPNRCTSDMLDYLYSDSKGMTYAKNPSNLVEPLRVNEKFEFKSAYDPWKLKSMIWSDTRNQATDL